MDTYIEINVNERHGNSDSPKAMNTHRTCFLKTVQPK